MSRIIRQGHWVAAVVVVVIYTLCVAASPCYGKRDPCFEGNVHKLGVLPTSSVSSDLPSIPNDSINIGGVRDCETSSISHQAAKNSAFGIPRIARKLGEEDGSHGESVGTPGMRLSLSRRSSHPSSSEANMHPMESLQRSMKRDFHRVNGFVKRILLTAQPKEEASYMRPKFREGFPDLTHPGGRKDQPTDQSASLNSSSGLYKFESTVKSGVPFGSGEYFMDFYVGTPPRHFSVIIDTGSDLTWVQCDPCELCYHQDGPVFQPNMSSTYQGLTCNAESCKSGGGYGDDPNRCQATTKEPGLCRYFYYYGDLSNTTGDFALETVTFPVSKGDPLQIEQILFGCGHSNIGLFQGAGGLLGLGQGPISFVSQIGKLFGDKFSYCLVDRDDPSYIGSPLIFGEDEIYKVLQPRFQWTPFLKNTPVDTFYYVNITAVSVGGERLKIPETAWQVDMDGYGGTIIDSGTTLSYFRQEAYDAIKQAFVDRISYPVVTTVPVLSLCYNVSGVQSTDFPSLSIIFKGDAVMDLPFKNYFIRPDPAENVYCLALLGMPQKSLNILGNFLSQNFHIVFDRGNVRLGFAPVDCTSIL
ncbi:unnamed protein product [Calypogeia fissa]